MQYTQLTPDLRFSRLVQGFWREAGWHLAPEALYRFICGLLDNGIDTFDHAACYGGFTVEGRFGRALSLDKTLREKLTIISKCGILFPNAAEPQFQTHHYDNSYRHIIWSAERSIKEMQCGYLDVLLIHRPSPCADPEQIARAFDDLQRAGKVRHFGVSNYSPAKFSMLQSYVAQPLVTNQIEISPLHLLPFHNGELDFMLEKRVRPMAWSPLGGGGLFTAGSEQSRRTAEALLSFGKARDESRLDVLAYAWLLAHPSGIIPVMGSGRIERCRQATAAFDIAFSEEEWLQIYIASQGLDIP